MRSFHNDPKIKEKFVLRFAEHRAADAVIQGQGYQGGRGCFVGCTLKNYDHAQFPIELGWPEWLARLADNIFEGLPKAEAPQFGTDLLDAVPVGVDLEPVRWQLAIWRHKRDLERLAENKEPYAEQCREALRQVITYCEAELSGTAAARSAARSAAWSAAESAWSAAESAAESARSAAWSARSSARSAWSAAESAWSAAESAWSAAESARSSARSSAWSAAESAAWSARSAARSAAWSARSAAWSARSSARSAWSAAESARSARSSAAHFQSEREALLGFLRAAK